VQTRFARLKKLTQTSSDKQTVSSYSKSSHVTNSAAQQAAAAVDTPLKRHTPPSHAQNLRVRQGDSAYDSSTPAASTPPTLPPRPRQQRTDPGAVVTASGAPVVATFLRPLRGDGRCGGKPRKRKTGAKVVQPQTKAKPKPGWDASFAGAAEEVHVPNVRNRKELSRPPAAGKSGPRRHAHDAVGKVAAATDDKVDAAYKSKGQAVDNARGKTTDQHQSGLSQIPKGQTACMPHARRLALQQQQVQVSSFGSAPPRIELTALASLHQARDWPPWHHDQRAGKLVPAPGQLFSAIEQGWGSAAERAWGSGADNASDARTRLSSQQTIDIRSPAGRPASQCPPPDVFYAAKVVVGDRQPSEQSSADDREVTQRYRVQTPAGASVAACQPRAAVVGDSHTSAAVAAQQSTSYKQSSSSGWFDSNGIALAASGERLTFTGPSLPACCAQQGHELAAAPPALSQAQLGVSLERRLIDDDADVLLHTMTSAPSFAHLHEHASSGYGESGICWTAAAACGPFGPEADVDGTKRDQVSSILGQSLEGQQSAASAWAAPLPTSASAGFQEYAAGAHPWGAESLPGADVLHPAGPAGYNLGSLLDGTLTESHGPPRTEASECNMQQSEWQGSVQEAPFEVPLMHSQRTNLSEHWSERYSTNSSRDVSSLRGGLGAAT
jgi:hypothetical protein